mmetsp:Transcript_10697/g.44227  ORF Transcript_10697/g.44227 Transcript_10697/m.44227 type:complete len:526 (+) Transcript_10697:1909-3486(+)
MVRLMHGTSKLPCSMEPTVYPLPLSDACAFFTSDALSDANFGSMPPFWPSARVTPEPHDVVVDRRAAISLTLKMSWCSPRSLRAAAPGAVSPGPSFSSAPDLGLCGGMSAHSSTRSASVNQAQIAAERCVTCLPISSASVDGRDRRVATCATVSVSSSSACTPLGRVGGGNDSNLSRPLAKDRAAGTGAAAFGVSSPSPPSVICWCCWPFFLVTSGPHGVCLQAASSAASASARAGKGACICVVPPFGVAIAAVFGVRCCGGAPPRSSRPSSACTSAALLPRPLFLGRVVWPSRGARDETRPAASAAAQQRWTKKPSSDSVSDESSPPALSSVWPSRRAAVRTAATGAAVGVAIGGISSRGVPAGALPGVVAATSPRSRWCWCGAPGCVCVHMTGTAGCLPIAASDTTWARDDGVVGCATPLDTRGCCGCVFDSGCGACCCDCCGGHSAGGFSCASDAAFCCGCGCGCGCVCCDGGALAAARSFAELGALEAAAPPSKIAAMRAFMPSIAHGRVLTMVSRAAVNS